MKLSGKILWEHIWNQDPAEKIYISWNTEAFPNTWRISASYYHLVFGVFFLWQPNCCRSYHHPGISAYIKSPWQQCSIIGKGIAGKISLVWNRRCPFAGLQVSSSQALFPKNNADFFSLNIYFNNEKHLYFVLLLLHVSVIHFTVIN